MGVPMIDDIELKAAQYVREETEQDFVHQKILGLAGTLHQSLGRRSHRVLVRGLFLPDSAADDLKKLQDKAKAGDEVTFTADITTALEIDKMLIESFRAEQTVGPTGQIAYTLVLSESPPLPPPAEVSSFGGLGDFGAGDLGFDPGALGDVLADVQNQAGALMDAASAAVDAVDKLQSLANLGNLANVGNPIKPVADQVGAVKSAGEVLKGIAGGLKAITG
jgi:hypothetical protein